MLKKFFLDFIQTDIVKNICLDFFNFTMSTVVTTQIPLFSPVITKRFMACLAFSNSMEYMAFSFWCTFNRLTVNFAILFTAYNSIMSALTCLPIIFRKPYRLVYPIRRSFIFMPDIKPCIKWVIQYGPDV